MNFISAEEHNNLNNITAALSRNLFLAVLFKSSCGSRSLFSLPLLGFGRWCAIQTHHCSQPHPPVHNVSQKIMRNVYPVIHFHSIVSMVTLVASLLWLLWLSPLSEYLSCFAGFIVSITHYKPCFSLSLSFLSRQIQSACWQTRRVMYDWNSCR